MSEVIEQVTITAAEAAVKAIEPAAKDALENVLAKASSELQQFEARLPQLEQAAKTDARDALLSAETHLVNVIRHVRVVLGLDEKAPATDAEPAPTAPTPQS
jgi:hypothetical protein